MALGDPLPRMRDSSEATAVVELVDGVVRVRVHGEFDLANETTLAKALTLAVQSGGDVVVDLAETTFLDVGCLGLLLATRQNLANAGRSLVLRHAQPLVRRLAAAVHAEDMLSAD